MAAITIFMAAYNAGKYISKSIESILNQDFGDFELLIINDGSTDNTEQLISQYDDSRIRMLNNDGNKGLVYTRNRGISEAKGDYFAILDADDIAAPHRLSLQIDYFKKNPKAALCIGNATIINEMGVIIDKISATYGNCPVKENLFFCNPIVNSSAMFRTEVIKDLKYKEGFAPVEDYELFVRLSEDYEIGVINRILVEYRVHPMNVTKTKLDYKINGEKKIVSKLFSLFTIMDSYADIHYTFISGDFLKFSIKEYEDYLTLLSSKNRQMKRFDYDNFDKVILQKWLTVIRSRRMSLKLLIKYYTSPLFKYRYFSIVDLFRLIKSGFISTRGWATT